MMEEQIEEYLQDKYILDLEVKFKDFGKYLIYIKFEKLIAEINFTYDNHYTFEINMKELMNFIDQTIISYFKKEGK